MVAAAALLRGYGYDLVDLGVAVTVPIGVISPPGVMETMVEVLTVCLENDFVGLVAYGRDGEPSILPVCMDGWFCVKIDPLFIPVKDESTEGISTILLDDSLVLISLPIPEILLLLSC